MGNLGIKYLNYAFKNAKNLTSVPNSLPNGIINMESMFSGASSFNQDLDGWDVSNVTNMANIFYEADYFNGYIGNWQVGKVTNMNSMFCYASAFNQDIGTWNVSNVVDMEGMFSFASAFNQDLNTWNTANVTSMYYMFGHATLFNGNISNWDVSKVNNMQGMFYMADSFNQNIGNWNVSAVTNMSGMFQQASAFNGDISGWNVSNVSNFSNMFRDATSFNQNIGNWNVSNATNMSGMFEGITLSVENYDTLLNGWASQSLQSGVSFSGGNSQYSCVGVQAKSTLTDTYSWYITDGGQNTDYLSAPVITTQPTNQDLSAGGSATFTVAVSNPYGVSYQWQKDGTDLSDGGSISGSTTNELTVSNVASSDEGNYQCVITNCEGESTTSDIATLTVASSTNINEISITNIKIYPNPATNIVHIELAEGSNISITDISGKTLKSVNIVDKKGIIDVSVYSSGIYFIKIENKKILK